MCVIVSNFRDHMPEPFSAEGYNYDCEDFFRRFKSWVQFQEARLPDDDTKVDAFKYVLSDSAILWWNAVVAIGNIPATVNQLKDLFYAKCRLTKTRQDLNRYLKECKYVPGVSCLLMINKFQKLCRKLDLLLAVQIEIFVRLLPAILCQIVVSRNIDGFDGIKISVKTYQEMIELYTVSTSIAFKNFSFDNMMCCM